MKLKNLFSDKQINIKENLDIDERYKLIENDLNSRNNNIHYEKTVIDDKEFDFSDLNQVDKDSNSILCLNNLNKNKKKLYNYEHVCANYETDMNTDTYQDVEVNSVNEFLSEINKKNKSLKNLKCDFNCPFNKIVKNYEKLICGLIEEMNSLKKMNYCLISSLDRKDAYIQNINRGTCFQNNPYKSMKKSSKFYKNNNDKFTLTSNTFNSDNRDRINFSRNNGDLRSLNNKTYHPTENDLSTRNKTLESKSENFFMFKNTGCALNKFDNINNKNKNIVNYEINKPKTPNFNVKRNEILINKINTTESDCNKTNKNLNLKYPIKDIDYQNIKFNKEKKLPTNLILNQINLNNKINPLENADQNLKNQNAFIYKKIDSILNDQISEKNANSLKRASFKKTSFAYKLVENFFKEVKTTSEDKEKKKNLNKKQILEVKEEGLNDKSGQKEINNIQGNNDVSEIQTNFKSNRLRNSEEKKNKNIFRNNNKQLNENNNIFINSEKNIIINTNNINESNLPFITNIKSLKGKNNLDNAIQNELSNINNSKHHDNPNLHIEESNSLSSPNKESIYINKDSKFFTDKNSHYNKIINLVKIIGKSNKETKSRLSYLSLSDSVLKKMVSSDLLNEISKLTQNDKEFVYCMRNFKDDEILVFNGLLSQLIFDHKYTLELIRRVKSFLKLSVRFVNTTILDKTMKNVIKNCKEVIDCEKTFIYVFDKYSKMLILYSEDILNNQKPKISVDYGVAGSVFKKGKRLKIDNADIDPRFIKDNTKLESIENNFQGISFEIKEKISNNKNTNICITGNTKTILCLPFFDIDGEVCGVLECINKKNGCFLNDDEELSEIFAKQISYILQNSIQFDECTSHINRLKSLNEFSITISKIKSKYEFTRACESILMSLWSVSEAKLYFYEKKHETDVFNGIKDIDFSTNKNVDGGFNINNKNKESSISNEDEIRYYESGINVKTINKNIGLIGKCINKRQIVICENIYDNKDYNSIVDLENGSLVTVPILDFDYQMKVALVAQFGFHFKNSKKCVLKTNHYDIIYLFSQNASLWVSNNKIKI